MSRENWSDGSRMIEGIPEVVNGGWLNAKVAWWYAGSDVASGRSRANLVYRLDGGNSCRRICGSICWLTSTSCDAVDRAREGVYRSDASCITTSCWPSSVRPDTDTWSSFSWTWRLCALGDKDVVVMDKRGASALVFFTRSEFPFVSLSNGTEPPLFLLRATALTRALPPAVRCRVPGRLSGPRRLGPSS